MLDIPKERERIKKNERRLFPVLHVKSDYLRGPKPEYWFFGMSLKV
jgi:hypothetical protein